MTTRHFTVNVPNPSDGSGVATLRLEPVTEAQLTAFGYDLPTERLNIRAARLTTSASASTLTGCLDAVWMAILAILSLLLRRPVPLRPLNVRLEPRSAADVRVSIDVVGAKGAAAMHLIDRRGGKVVGGVTLLVIEGAVNAPSGPIPARNPCPIVLTNDPFWLPVGSRPDSPRFAGPIPVGYDVDLVAWITNPTNEILTEATAYLEHLGGADAEFLPSTWNLGDFDVGAAFPLRWRISPRPWASGRWSASIVVESKGFDPIRLRSPLEFGSLEPVEVRRLGDAAVEPA